MCPSWDYQCGTKKLLELFLVLLPTSSTETVLDAISTGNETFVIVN
jgi:hypothetical protein